MIMTNFRIEVEEPGVYEIEARRVLLTITISMCDLSIVLTDITALVCH
jgi:hypothetical protein